MRGLGSWAVAITDHGNVQSFPWLSSAQPVLKLFGMEANIVEDSVPIAYNVADVVLSDALMWF